MAKHPVIGKLVSGYFAGQHCVALAVNVRFPRRGDRSPKVAVRLHGGPATMEDGSDWGTVVGRYQGKKVEVPVTAIKSVCPGDGEGWVSGREFFEFVEK